MPVLLKPTDEELLAASREQRRLAGLQQRGRIGLAWLVLLLPLALLTRGWGLVALVVMLIAILPLLLRATFRKLALQSPLRFGDNQLEAAPEGLTLIGPTASSRMAWAHFGAWSRIDEGLLLVPARTPRIYYFIPRSALDEELAALITSNVPKHAKAR